MEIKAQDEQETGLTSYSPKLKRTCILVVIIYNILFSPVHAIFFKTDFKKDIKEPKLIDLKSKLKIYLLYFNDLIILLERFITKYFICKGENAFKVNIKTDKLV